MTYSFIHLSYKHLRNIIANGIAITKPHPIDICGLVINFLGFSLNIQ